MRTKQNPIEMPLIMTEQPHEPPEERLRFISNYSSLERMANKANKRKVWPQIVNKQEAGQIIGWSTNSVRNSSHSSSPKKNRSKFNQTTRNLTGHTHTLVSDISPSQRTIAHHLHSQQHRDKALHRTNFKYGLYHPMTVKKDPLKTISTIQYLQPESMSVQKSKWLDNYKELASERKMERSMWPVNPQYRIIGVTEYPIMHQGRFGRNHGKKRDRIMKLFGM